MTKTVLVTGSSRGIGRAVALKLASDGYDLVIHHRNSADAAEDVRAAIAAMGREARILRFDVSDRAATEAALLADVEQHGAYYGVVCNAGIARDNAFPSLTGDEWDQVLHTNLDSFYNVLNPLVMPMIRRREPGRVVTMSSVSGVMGNRGQVNYSAAKAGIIGATKALALELAKRNITVNCVAPGLIETEMLGELPVDEISKIIPCRRLGKPEEVASAVSFLMSEGAAYITRQVISINGGMC
ncbi:3-oxoacyl-ACP reductase FabG [Porticoccus sp. W117]|uniref:3-oxoacyl-ACP reductase FabG n=1 Tax=Porticoccus sp. W117 TaxID=3054777 RepID=UPI002597AADB|nr:3-oxoacyl-ACP reductase FabG [Porticoccus sp. W117]MDM3869844.1 3-oxoacyl-ACP reductase FabG [Porticoccus sp. W117]